MLKNFRDKIALSGITVLAVGIALLVFTFISAYGFLTAGLSIIASEDLVQTFGEALAPLIATCIRIMYLGIMGWIASLITVRGVTIIAHVPQQQPVVTQTPQAAPQAPATAPQKPQPQKGKTEKPKEKEKETPKQPAPEPQFVVIPPEAIAAPTQPQQKESQDNEPTQPSS